MRWRVDHACETLRVAACVSRTCVAVGVILQRSVLQRDHFQVGLDKLIATGGMVVTWLVRVFRVCSMTSALAKVGA